MKKSQLIIGTIIALILILGLVLMLKGGKTSNSEQTIPTKMSQ